MSTKQRRKVRLFAAKYQQMTGHKPLDRNLDEPPREWATRCINHLMTWAANTADELEADSLMMSSRSLP